MADFHEVRLPEKFSRGAEGGPLFATDVVMTGGGHEQRNSKWAQPLGEWNIGHLIKSRQAMQELVEFFHLRAGRAYGFRFKWWLDYQATTQPLGTGDGALVDFQLRRVWSDAYRTQIKTIRKPVAGTVVVYLDGIAQSSGWSVDMTTGVVTFGTAPAVGVAVSADFEFDYPVRFDTDVQRAVFESIKAQSWPDIPLKELRPREV